MADRTPDKPSENTTAKALRWWPAALLVVAMIVLRNLPSLFEAPSLPIFMISFMGPAGLGILVMAWWLFASRATIKEKLIGFFGVGILLVVASYLCHFTMQEMGLMLFVVPVGVASFAIPLVLLANLPSVRVPVALVCSLLGFGYWTLLKSEGVTGTFASQLSWRWKSNGEERYLESIVGKQKPVSEAAANEVSGDNSVAKEAITLASASWPAFRGASRDGKLVGISLNEDWMASPPKLIWKTLIGPGWSSFSVAGNRLFTQEQRGEKEAVVCLDASTGRPIWEYEYVSRFWESIAGAGPRATPTIADEGLFALGANGVLVCLNARNGQKIWERDLQTDSGRKPPMWGFASSPLVTEGVVIVHAGGAKDKGLLAYDAKTGEPLWSIASGDHSYSSAQTATFDSVTGVLMETNSGLQFVRAKDGSEIWNFESPTSNYRTLQPLVLGNTVLLANSLGEGTKKITVAKDGDRWNVNEVWATKDMKPDFNDFVEHQGSLYGFDGSIFASIDLETGKRQWKKGRYGNGQVLMLCDAGQMLLTSEKGELVLLKADSKSMVELAKFPAIEGKTWNHSVVVGNRIYIRNAEQAACYELATK
jgi:outer membrane protein assembly factor BamB